MFLSEPSLVLTEVNKLVWRTGVQPVGSGEADDDTEARDQQEDDGDLEGTAGVAPLVVHLQFSIKIIFFEN